MERVVGWYLIKTTDGFDSDGVEVAYWSGHCWNLAGTEYPRGEVEVLSGKLDLAALMNKD